MPPRAGLLALALLTPAARAAAPAPAPAPAAYATVLARRGLDAERLKALGFGCDRAACFRADASGRALPPALTPEELDAALGLLPPPPQAAAPREAPRSVPLLKLDSSLSAASLGRIYDGAASGAADVVIPQAATPPMPAPPRPPYVEPPFEGNWTAVAADLKVPARRARALRKIAAAFQPDETSPTGLGPDAPEALRLVAYAVHRGFGGPGAAVELRRELALVAEFEARQKYAFAETIASPLTVFAALERSRATHSLDSQLYFRRMETLLAADGRTLTSFLEEIDPADARTPMFLLRAYVYDALIPYLGRHPAEGRAVARLLFPDGRASETAGRASALEGFMAQLAATGRSSGALASFVAGLEDRAATADPATADRVAIYLKINEKLLPKSLRPGVDSAAARLPPGLLEDSGLLPPEPAENWPDGEWTFVLHFASTASYNAFLTRFQARGYARGMDSDGASLTKDFGFHSVKLLARLYPGDKDGFMRGAVAQRFLKGVARDLRDPDIQGVILRNHAQFRVGKLFGKGVNPGKLVLDGSCRSAWDVQNLRRSCPTCAFIVNSGTGQGRVNNDAVIAVIEGLASGYDWNEIGDQWSRLSPAESSRIQGPWTPPYPEAVALLASRERAAAKAAKQANGDH